MRAEERRKEIAQQLRVSKAAISGSELAGRFGVSRQVIVQDISILKAEGYDILSIHHGYMMIATPLCERVFKLKHTAEQTEDKLNCIVDNGGTVADVFVWHKVYGRVCAKLNISSRYHVKQFIEGVRSGKSTELMNITGGYHYHTVLAQSEDVLDIIEQVLDGKGYLVPEI